MVSATRNIMDAQDFDKLADKLVQFRGKIPQNAHLHQYHSRIAAKRLRVRIDNLLDALDHYAKKDNLGWIK